VRVPEDVRRLVEMVYGQEDRKEYPAALEQYWIEAKGDQKAARSHAGANLLSVAKGYGGSDEEPGWDSDTRTPTRLGDDTITLRLARLEDGRIVPWCRDLDRHRAWALSELKVRASRVKDVPEPAEAAGLRCREWTRYDEHKKLLLLSELGCRWWSRERCQRLPEQATLDGMHHIVAVPPRDQVAIEVDRGREIRMPGPRLARLEVESGREP
jgi:hypothetical protein